MMYKAIKKYNNGGRPGDPKKLEGVKDTIAYTGEGGEKKYDVNTLLDILKYTNSMGREQDVEGISGSLSGVDFGGGSADAQYAEAEAAKDAYLESIKPVAYRDKQGNYRVATRDEESGLFNPAVGVTALKKEFLDELAGQDLSQKELGEFRKLLTEPAFLDYFIGIQDTEPKKKNFRKVNIAKRVGKGAAAVGAGTTGGGSVDCTPDGKGGLTGPGCNLIRQGKSHSWSD